MSRDLEEKLKEIEAKISREESVIDGFKTMMCAHSKRNLRTQCEEGILQSKTILSYFYSERERIKELLADQYLKRLSSDFNGFAISSAQSFISKKSRSSFLEKPVALDFRKYNAPLSREMLAFRAQEIEHKLSIEDKVLEAVNKYYSSIALSKNLTSKESQQEADVKHFDSSEKSRIYSLALRELKPLILATLNQNGGSQESLPLNTGIRLPVSGRLSIKILDSQNIVSGENSELLISLQIDGVNKGVPFKLSGVEGGNIHFVLDVERAYELEILVHSRSAARIGLIGLLWIPLIEILENLRRRTSAGPGFKSYNNYSEEVRDNETSEISDGFQVIQDWFKLEPVVRQFENVRVKAKLERQGAVRKSRQQVAATLFGHKFAPHQIYRPHKCAVCHKLTIKSSGFQCQDCHFFCHSDCARKVYSKCIASVDSEGNKKHNLSELYNIPHRFEGPIGLTACWCCHCGRMLSLIRSSGKKCLDCDLTCHINCQSYVLNFCGMNSELASQLLKSRKPHTLSDQSNVVISKKPESIRLTVPQNIETVFSNESILSPLYCFPSFLYEDCLAESPMDISHFTSYESKFSGYKDVYDNNNTSKIKRKSFNLLSEVLKPSGNFNIQDFKLLSVLGRGNFGKVLLAQLRIDKQLVAVKVLKKSAALVNEEVDALRNEKKVFILASKARHPFLLHLHACFQTPGSIVFVMEYVPGGDLMSLIQRKRVFSPEQTRFYAIEVILALDFLHSNDIVYRDLKLDNLLLSESGHIKLADYGLCRLNLPYGKFASTFCGTPEFMAPELLESHKYGRAVDWWSLGVLLYQMILGQSPFTGSDDNEVFTAILQDDVFYPSTLSKTIISIIQNLLTRDPIFRLGGGPGDSKEVMTHLYFHDTDWEAYLHRRVPPPHIPHIARPTDVTNFDKQFTKQTPKITPTNSILAPHQQSQFLDFEYISEYI